MIPNTIVRYLMENRVAFRRHWHTRAVSAQELAAAVHVSGHHVAKSVVVEAGGRQIIAVLPATDMLDVTRVAMALKADSARILRESELENLFPDCELGAEPPFGGLYQMPVVLDEKLAGGGLVVFRAGSHEETVELTGRDFISLENPIVASISTHPAAHEAQPGIT
jgi:Ala-tRNA(Pro) deacylase